MREGLILHVDTESLKVIDCPCYDHGLHKHSRERERGVYWFYSIKRCGVYFFLEGPGTAFIRGQHL